jgi:DNA polymerase IV
VENWQILARMLAELTREAVGDMKSHTYLARTFTVKVRFSDFHTLTRAKTIPEDTDNEEQIRKTAFSCLKRIDLNKPVRLIGIRLSNLHKRK